jgi:hypothetical protein
VYALIVDAVIGERLEDRAISGIPGEQGFQPLDVREVLGLVALG